MRRDVALLHGSGHSIWKTGSHTLGQSGSVEDSEVGTG